MPGDYAVFSAVFFSYLRDMNLCKFVGLRFLQGPETDQSTVQKIRDAIRDQREITVQLINYTKSGKLSHNETFFKKLSCKFPIWYAHQSSKSMQERSSGTYSTCNLCVIRRSP